MDQERLRVLVLPVLLQSLQQVVLEISARMMELEGGNGCGGGGGGGGNSYAGCGSDHDSYMNGCGAHGDSSMAGGGGSSLLEPVACGYSCYYCKNRCTRGHKAGHKHHTCHEHKNCRH